jgi:NifB/MoaA-like Fe-S oxidoreductase
MERQTKRVRQSRMCMRTLPTRTIDVRRYEVDEALAVIAQSEPWQERFRRERGETFFYLGDEFYLMTETPVPPRAHYDELGQIEDGIGITRVFLDDAARVTAKGRLNGVMGMPGIIACGTLIGPTMERTVAEVNAAVGTTLSVVPVENTFFGGEINISGLLTGGELARAFGERPGDEPLFISSTMISRRTMTLLDDMTVDELATTLRRDVIVAEHLSDVVAELAHLRFAA